MCTLQFSTTHGRRPVINDLNTGATRTIAASEFRANCLKLMDAVQASGQPIIVTKHGVPVVRIEPHRPRMRAPFGCFKHLFRHVGDIESPIDVEWDAESNPDRVLDPQ